MKKLLNLAMLSWCSLLAAQNNGTQNSFAIVTGANWFHQLSNVYVNADFTSRAGYNLGFEYALEISRHWHLIAGFQYIKLNYRVVAGPFFDPMLPTYVNFKAHDYVCQFLAGMRRISKPAIWRYYLDAEMGYTTAANREGFQQIPQGKIVPTVSIGGGMAWQPVDRGIQVFVQPSVHYIFQKPSNDIFRNRIHFFMPVVEFGVRNYL